MFLLILIIIIITIFVFSIDPNLHFSGVLRGKVCLKTFRSLYGWKLDHATGEDGKKLEGPELKVDIIELESSTSDQRSA